MTSLKFRHHHQSHKSHHCGLVPRHFFCNSSFLQQDSTYYCQGCSSQHSSSPADHHGHPHCTTTHSKRLRQLPIFWQTCLIQETKYPDLDCKPTYCSQHSSSPADHH